MEGDLTKAAWVAIALVISLVGGELVSPGCSRRALPPATRDSPTPTRTATETAAPSVNQPKTPGPTLSPSVSPLSTTSQDSTRPQATRVISPTPSDSATPESYTELLSKAALEGHVWVIVGLELPTGPFIPEGNLSASEIQQQRQTIVTTREALLDSLAGYDVEAYASWDSIPYVALKVDREGLQHLIDSRYVSTIQEDTLDQPHGGDSADDS